MTRLRGRASNSEGLVYEAGYPLPPEQLTLIVFRLPEVAVREEAPGLLAYLIACG